VKNSAKKLFYISAFEENKTIMHNNKTIENFEEMSEAFNHSFGKYC